jgi:hypothetical protein
MAQSVSESTARTVAENFISSRSNAAQKKPIDLINITTAIDAKYDGFYIFKNSLGNGFYIISSEYENHPILGYSDDTTISSSGQVSPGFLYVLDWYQSVNEGLRNSSLKSKGTGDEDELSSKIKEEWEVLLSSGGNNYPLGAKTTATTAVLPLLKTTWNSNAPYNQKIPNNASTGSVATAMAQIMKFWERPTTGVGEHSYTWSGGTSYANFGETTYDWANMPNSLSSSSTDAQKDAVSTLIYHAGVSVNTNWENSSALYINVAYALKNYFNYADVSYIKRNINSYPDVTWLALIKDQITKRFPVFFSGLTASGHDHAFVADGYDSNNLIHFNFGWGGSDDGYFTILHPNPPNSGNDGYSIDQAVVINIYPPDCGPVSGLYVSDITDGGVTFNWTVKHEASSYTVEYKTADASEWTTMPSTINTYYSIHNHYNTQEPLLANTTYNWRVKANCSSEYTTGDDFTTLLYCTSQGNDASEKRISEVYFSGGISNDEKHTVGGGITDGYEDFTLSFFPGFADKGATHNIIIIPNSSGSLNAYAVFIDFNHDGDFDDEGETVLEQITPDDSLHGIIYIPPTALSGVTRVRISMKYYNGNGMQGPCDTFEQGQVEDYNIDITGDDYGLGTDDVQTNSASSILYPNPVKDILHIKGINNTGNVEYTKVTIIDRNGRTVKTTQVKVEDIIEVNVSDLPPNIYYLNILGESYKFIKTDK